MVTEMCNCKDKHIYAIKLKNKFNHENQMFTDTFDSCPTRDECSDIYGDVNINRKTLLKNTYT